MTIDLEQRSHLPLGIAALDVELYSRQLILPGVGGAGQQKLRAGTILLIGVGGLGAPAATYLAAAGVGRLILVDPDVVELSNLPRQFLFDSHDVGKSKVAVATERLKRSHPRLELEGLSCRPTKGELLSLLTRCQVVLEGSDSYESKFLVNDCAQLRGVPAVIGAVRGYEGQLMTVLPDRNGCYRCLFEGPPPTGERESCREAGILGPVAGVVGSLMATEALKVLLAQSQTPERALLHFDALDLGMRRIHFQRRDDCTGCSDLPKSAGR